MKSVLKKWSAGLALVVLLSSYLAFTNASNEKTNAAIAEEPTTSQAYTPKANPIGAETQQIVTELQAANVIDPAYEIGSVNVTNKISKPAALSSAPAKKKSSNVAALPKENDINLDDPYFEFNSNSSETDHEEHEYEEHEYEEEEYEEEEYENDDDEYEHHHHEDHD